MLEIGENKTVCWAILVRNGSRFLPQYLRRLLAQDYDKKLIHLYIRTNDNADDTETLIEDFIFNFGSRFSGVTYINDSIKPEIKDLEWHEWPVDSLQIMARIRQEGLDFASKNDFDYYFVSDVDNFLTSKVLTELIKLDLPVVAPYLVTPPGDLPRYRNFHERIGPIGEFLQSERNLAIVARELVGVLQVDLVHCTYLVKSDVMKYINYKLMDANYEYRNFALSLKQNSPETRQFLDARQIWGCLIINGSVEACEELMFELEDDVKSFNPVAIEKELFLANNSLYKKNVVTSRKFTDRHEIFQSENRHITFEFVFDYGQDIANTQNDYPSLKGDSSKLRPGSIDRALSHIRLLQDAVTNNEMYLILEDDAKLHKDFDRLLESMLSNQKEFDFMLLGFNFDSYVFVKDDESPTGVLKHSFSQTSLVDSWDELAHTIPLPQPRKLLNGWGLGATLTSPAGAQKILTHLREFESEFINIGDLSITTEVKSFDAILNPLYRELQAYVAVPPIVWFKNLKSESKIWTDNL